MNNYFKFDFLNVIFLFNIYFVVNITSELLLLQFTILFIEIVPE